jgi:hypothetical protein
MSVDDRGDKYFFGTVIADYAFETYEVKKNFFSQSDDIFLVLTNDECDGWTVIEDANAQTIFDIKKIPYNSHTHAWFLSKKYLFSEGYTLDDGMVMKSE